MSQKYSPSKPFPNGMTYDFFLDNFCGLCKKYKADSHGMPLPGNCSTEEALAQMVFGLGKWPDDDIVQVGDMHHICLHFESEDAELMTQYRAIFE